MCILITIIVLILGIQFVDNNISNFSCSVTIGITTGYITGAIATYLAEKQTESLMLIDEKIKKLEYYKAQCKMEMSIWHYNSENIPVQKNIYNVKTDKEFLSVLFRMGAVCDEISKCSFYDFSNIDVEFHTSDEEHEMIKLKDFNHKLNSFAIKNAQEKNGDIGISRIQCNNLFMNVMKIEYELDKVKNILTKEKEICSIKDYNYSINKKLTLS